MRGKKLFYPWMSTAQLHYEGAVFRFCVFSATTLLPLKSLRLFALPFLVVFSCQETPGTRQCFCLYTACISIFIHLVKKISSILCTTNICASFINLVNDHLLSTVPSFPAQAPQDAFHSFCYQFGINLFILLCLCHPVLLLWKMYIIINSHVTTQQVKL